MSVQRIFVCALVLCATAAQAQARYGEGEGRISLMGGWRYTPNDFFIEGAAKKGLTVRQSAGGPQLTGTFAYAATGNAEIAIDLFAGYDRMELDGREALSTISYGALLGFRFFFPMGAFTPNVGAAVGPALVYASGGGYETEERFTTNYAAMAGVVYRLNEKWALGADVRFMLSRGYVPEIGGINAGGLWGGVGFTWLFPAEPGRQGAIR